MEDIVKTPSGIGRLDADTGGFHAGKLHFVSGGAHTAKTIFTAQFLRQGLLLDENALLLTEIKPPDFLGICRDLEMDMDDFLKTGQFVLIKYLFQAEDIIRGEKDLAVLLGEFENFILANRVSRAAVDTAVPLFRMFHPDWFEKGFNIFASELEKLGVTMLLTGRMPASQKSLEIKNRVESRVAGSVHLDELKKPGGKTTRKMAVRKMNRLQPPYPVYEFEIMKREGIAVTSRSKTGLDSPREKIKERSRGYGLLFSREYEESPPEGGKEPRKENAPGPNHWKKVSFYDKYDIDKSKGK